MILLVLVGYLIVALFAVAMAVLSMIVWIPALIIKAWIHRKDEY